MHWDFRPWLRQGAVGFAVAAEGRAYGRVKSETWTDLLTGQAPRRIDYSYVFHPAGTLV